VSATTLTTKHRERMADKRVFIERTSVPKTNGSSLF
jgi:hypothetical protein